MNKRFIFLPVIMLAIMASCGGNENKNNTDSSARISDSLAPDSTESDSIEIRVNDSVVEKVRKFPTTQVQVNYMKEESGNWDKYQTGILPQMAEEVPSYCEKLLQSKHDYFFIVDKAKMKLFIYDKYGNEQMSCGIACARNYGTKQRKGDSRTTEGFFNAVGVFDSTNWLFTNDAGYTSPARGAYGPRFIRLNTPYIGIHGTSSPGSIGRRASHGCIRVTNDNIWKVIKYVDEGMPIIISPGPKDMAVNKRDGYNVPSVTTEPGGTRAVPGNYDASQIGFQSSGSTKKSQDKEQVEESPEEAAPGNTEANPVSSGKEQAPATPVETPKVEKSEAPATPASSQSE